MMIGNEEEMETDVDIPDYKELLRFAHSQSKSQRYAFLLTSV